jgi:hypothetical protein
LFGGSTHFHAKLVNSWSRKILPRGIQPFLVEPSVKKESAKKIVFVAMIKGFP